MKSLIIILLLFSFQAESQTPMHWLRKKASACTYLLDTYTSASAAYSLRKLDVDFVGSAIRVRRSSDNTEQDIGFTGTCGDLDTASMKTFVGTGGTDDGFVVTWYDQSGNSRNATEATAGNQPKIMDNGVVYRSDGNVGVYFLNTSDNILTATFIGFSISTTSVFGVFTDGTGDASKRVFSFCTAAQQDYENYCPFIETASGSYGAYTNGGFRAGVAGFSNTVPNIFTGISDGTNVKNSLNGGSTTDYAFTTPTHTIDRVTIGASALSTGAKTDGNFTGFVSEVIFYASDKTSDKSGILSNINTYWTVY